MNVRIVQSLSTEQWRTFVEQHPKGNIFHTPEMYEVYRLAKGHKPELWAALEGEQILALMIPVRIALAGGPLRFLTTRSVAFGGVLCAGNPKGYPALKELLQQYKSHTRNSSLFTEIRNVSSLEGIKPVLAEAGFEYEDHLNYLIELESCTENVFNRIGARTRKHIRHGIRRNNVHVVEVTERELLPTCYSLLCQAYRNARVPVADISLFYAAFDCLVPKKMARFTLAFVSGEPAAVSLDLLYKNVVYGWYGGIDRKFIAEVPNEILMWNVLEWASNHGYQLYDFGGAGKPNEKYGVRDFKAKFGGELVCFGRNTWVSNPALMTVSKVAYSLLRRILFQQKR